MLTRSDKSELTIRIEITSNGQILATLIDLPDIQAQASSKEAALASLEIQKGRFKNIDEAKNSPRLVVSYRWLQETIADFDKLSILPFSERAYLHYDQFRTQQLRIGSQDLRIAAITMANEGILVTRNRKDFEKVPNLSIVDWTLAEEIEQMPRS